MCTARFPRTDNFSTLFCRSSDLFPVYRLPIFYKQWHEYDTLLYETHSNGTVQDSHLIPFSSEPLNREPEQNVGKDRNIL